LKARESRALLRHVRSLAEAGEFAQAKLLLESTDGALASVRLRNTYANLLRELDDADGFERILTETIRLDPGNGWAIKTFLGFDKGQVHGDADIARCRDDFERGGSGGIFLARAAAMAMGRRDDEQASDFARRAVEAVAQVREPLASLFIWHGRIGLAERLARHGRETGDRFDVLWDLVSLRSVATFDDTTLALFAELTEHPNPHRAAALARYFNYRWQVFGASSDLLEQSQDWERHFAADDAALRSQRIALAYELGQRERAAKMLAERPACADAYSQVLPIAKLLQSDPGLAQTNGIEADAVNKFATLYDDLGAGTARLESKLRDPKLRVAIVGNSACEIGLGRGPAIDAHDIVIRFNKAPDYATHAADYGSRINVHGLRIRGEPGTHASPHAGFVLFMTSHPRGRNRDWNYALRLRHRGQSPVFIPGDGFCALAHQLNAPPSNGLRVCAHLHTLRGPLPHDSLFGFAFTDQIGPQAASSHYYERTVPSMHHNWPKEREIFRSLLRVEDPAR